MSKSPVSLEQHQCPICGTVHDTGNVLMDMRLRDSLEQRTVTRFGLCPECREQTENGFIAMVGLRGGTPRRATLKETWHLRLGEVVWIKRDAIHNITEMQIPEDQVLVFCDEGVIQFLKDLSKSHDKE